MAKKALTVRQFIGKLDKVQKELAKSKSMEPCLRRAHNDISVRIFVNGRDGKNQRFKSKKGKHRGAGYSREPAYYSDKEMPRKFKGGNTGKKGKKVFMDGRPHKTKYFKRGYKQLRSDQGVNQSFVDLNLTGNLSRDFSTSFISRRKLIWQVGVKRGENADKVKGIIKKYGTLVFKHTKKELDTLTKCLGLKAIQAHG